MATLPPKAIESLREEILQFNESITRENFFKSYDLMIEVIMPYRRLIKGKKEIVTLLTDILETESLDEFQEEVLMEVANIFSNWCSPSRMIAW